MGLPLLTVLVEWRGLRTGQRHYRSLARRWARGMGVLFAVDAVSGTILSFEMGLLWPGMMGVFGQVVGLPFAMEGIAFFIEAIFLGIYLYAWDRLTPRQHLLAGVPVIVAGVSSAWFVVSANAWMNQPRGFTLHDGRVVSVNPWAAMFNPATWPEALHMILAALLVASFLTASVYAVALLRGRRDAYHRTGFAVPVTVGAVAAPFQLVVGDWIARFDAHHEPTKLAAIEGVYRTGSHVPLTLGGVSDGHRLVYGLHIPDGLSLLVGYRPGTVVQGLDRVSADQRPPVTAVHLCFDVMVGIGFLLVALGVWLAAGRLAHRWRGRDGVPGQRLFTLLGAVAGPLAVVALECGWTVTEEGRQPWIVVGV